MPAPFYATITTAGNTIWLPDYNLAPFSANVLVVVPVGTTASYEVDYSLDDPNYPIKGLPAVTWLATAGFPAGSTTTLLGAFTAPLAQLRLNVASISGGPVYFKCLQGGFVGT
jgi:hypothetical protein